jgi:hypothetical protein
MNDNSIFSEVDPIELKRLSKKILTGRVILFRLAGFVCL